MRLIHRKRKWRKFLTIWCTIATRVKFGLQCKSKSTILFPSFSVCSPRYETGITSEALGKSSLLVSSICICGGKNGKFVVFEDKFKNRSITVVDSDEISIDTKT